MHKARLSNWFSISWSVHQSVSPSVCQSVSLSVCHWKRLQAGSTQYKQSYWVDSAPDTIKAIVFIIILWVLITLFSPLINLCCACFHMHRPYNSAEIYSALCIPLVHGWWLYFPLGSIIVLHIALQMIVDRVVPRYHPALCISYHSKFTTGNITQGHDQEANIAQGKTMPVCNIFP